MDSGDSYRSLSRQLQSAVGSDGARRKLALARTRRELLDRPIEVTHIGRFALLEHLGAGGFGSVYAAYDPVLDRKVAIKLLRNDARDGALLREARALARLAHPNVVTVHEVVEIDDRVVLVMGLIGGARLDRWVRDARPSVAQIVAAFVAAGRGLAAAHAQGLVHRDVKPANILVGEDGRARIVDFGLARLAPEFVDTGDDHGSASVRTNAAGTPSYWAPEVRVNGRATRASDQYAFCLSFRELLELAGGDVPRRVSKAIERGLQRDPAKRWPSMDALVAALARRPWPRGRIAAIAAAVAIAGGAPWVVEAAEEHEAGRQCNRDAGAIDPLWNDEASERIRGAFAATNLHYAAEAWARVEPRLAAYPVAWRDAYEEACRVVRVDRTRSEAAYTHTLACFDERRLAFGSLLDALAHADEVGVRQAVPAAFDLPDVAPCTDEAWLQQHPMPDEPSLAERVLELRVDLQRDAWRPIANDRDAALRSVLAMHERATALGWDPVLAEVELRLGRVRSSRGELEAARDALVSAYRRAGASGVDPVAADAAIALTDLVGGELAQPQQALVWAASAEMLLDRIDDHGRRRARHAGVVAGAYRRLGDLARAREYAERSLAVYEEAPDATEVSVAEALGSLAVMHVDAGDFDRAAVLLDRVLAIKTRVLGPNHPSITDTLLNLAGLDLARGAYDDALRHNERALAGALRLGEHHPEVLGIQANMSVIHLRLGHRDRALAIAREVVDARTELLGPSHPDTITALNNLGAVYVETGRFADARLLFADLLERQRATETSPLDVARTLHNLAAVTVKLGDPARARPHFVEALALLEQELGTEHPEVQRAREGLGVAELDAGNLDAAAAMLEPLLAARRRTLSEDDPELAQTLRNLGLVAFHRGDHEQALARFTDAEAIHRANGIDSQASAAVLHDLGVVHRELGHAAEAIAYLERALDLRTRILGPDHDETAATRVELGVVRKIAGS